MKFNKENYPKDLAIVRSNLVNSADKASAIADAEEYRMGMDEYRHTINTYWKRSAIDRKYQTLIRNIKTAKETCND